MISILLTVRHCSPMIIFMPVALTPEACNVFIFAAEHDSVLLVEHEPQNLYCSAQCPILQSWRPGGLGVAVSILLQ
jgi:hypothetical protein